MEYCLLENIHVREDKLHVKCNQLRLYIVLRGGFLSNFNLYINNEFQGPDLRVYFDFLHLLTRTQLSVQFNTKRCI